MEEMNVTVIIPSDRAYRIYREMCELLDKRVEEAPISQVDAITILTGVGIKILCSLNTARDAKNGTTHVPSKAQGVHRGKIQRGNSTTIREV